MPCKINRINTGKNFYYLIEHVLILLFQWYLLLWFVIVVYLDMRGQDTTRGQAQTTFPRLGLVSWYTTFRYPIRGMFNHKIHEKYHVLKRSKHADMSSGVINESIWVTCFSLCYVHF